MLAQLMQLVFFGGLAVSLVGRAMLPEPASKWLETNQMYVLGACFMCNMAAGQLLNTGGFEVSYNGAPVWSKIELYVHTTRQQHQPPYTLRSQVSKLVDFLTRSKCFSTISSATRLIGRSQ